MKPEELLDKLKLVKHDLQRCLGNVEYLRRQVEEALKDVMIDD